MEPLAQRIKRFRFEKDQRLFFDTNIWILLYGEHNAPDDPRVKTYSNAYKRIKDAGAVIAINGVVAGEFINRGLRDDYAFHHPLQTGRVDYKTYRASPEYAASVRAVTRSLQAIFAQCQRIESPFARCDISTILTDFSTGQSDWSDQMIIEQCREDNLILVTDDADFRGSELTILTRNSAYFKREVGN